MLRRTRWLLPLLCSPWAGAQDCTLEVASLNVAGQPANNDCGGPTLSFDGRFVAYSSVATDLVSGDTNGTVDCFVSDLRTGVAERVSVNSAGVQGNDISWDARISADGRHVAFLSYATNLDPKDTDGIQDVYIHDRVTKTTKLVSERYGTGFKSMGCTDLSISADGRWVAFLCTDSDVLPGVQAWNTFLRDTWLDSTEVASIGPAGQVVFGGGTQPGVSSNGRFVVFQNSQVSWGNAGPNAQNALWIRDRLLGRTTPITQTLAGTLADGLFGSPELSLDGSYVVFWSTSSDLLPPGEPHGIYDVVRWDRVSGELRAVSKSPQGDGLQGICSSPGISADGMAVVFATGAGNATTGTQRFNNLILTDLATDTSRSLMWNAAGEIANTSSGSPAISGDGRTAAFDSHASNLVRGITTNATQIYVRSCDKALPMAYCTPVKGATGCKVRLGSSGDPSASAGAGFTVRVEHAPAQAPVLLFYGTSGPWGDLLPQGWLCVKSPLSRAASGLSAGGAECEASWSLDFNAFTASGADPALGPGAVVHLQAWTRNAAGDAQLSDGLALVLAP